MKISYNWLKQFVEVDWDAEKTGALLTDLGLEVEGVTEYESVKGGLKGVVIGHVVECVPHPNADRLRLTQVDLGNGSPVQIVCGAPNVAAGQKVPVATVGTELFDAEGKAWKIKKGKIRGEESDGMSCAEDELGLGQSHDGIMILDNALEPGTPLAQVFELENDQVFEIGLTPNRADAMSHFGVARDLRAGLKQQEISKELITPSVSNFNVDNRSLRFDVEVENPELAPRYCGLTINNLLVQDSPDWLKNRLKSIGLNPINNVVDITNYVLHELGQPLHAFDAAKVKGNTIRVKTLPQDTPFVSLDGEERKLNAADLMICDGEDNPMCIAGVFGGIDSGVTENTTSIFLESAYFDPVSIRKTAKRHALNTDASFRFERGIDINTVEYALKRAALLIQEVAGGDLTSDIEDLYPKKVEPKQVFLTYKKIHGLIGQEIPAETIKSILTSLEIKVKNVSESGLGLEIPAYRVDVEREVDVIEEILRVYGYNQVDFSTKLNASIAPTEKYDDHRLQNVVGGYLASNGFYEIMTNSLSKPSYDEVDGLPNNPVTLLNPLSADLSVMRQQMLFGGLESIAHNINRKNDSLSFFEFGKTYHQYNDTREEGKHLALWVTGKRETASWNSTGNPAGFFYLKSQLESVFQRLGITNYSYKALEHPLFSEGLSLRVAKDKVGEFGVVKSSVLKQFGIKQEVLYADLDWSKLLLWASRTKIGFAELPKFPAVKRDFALLLDEGINFSEISQLAQQSERKLLKQVELFDVYTGDKLPKGKKSYAVSFTLQDDKATLKDKQIDKIMDKLRKTFESKLGAELR
jgi:phenylalanyl-tRNA synthetase beta chain